jgi:predicted  nucleic acid-binding Zn-ribbon protein
MTYKNCIAYLDAEVEAELRRQKDVREELSALDGRREWLSGKLTLSQKRIVCLREAALVLEEIHQ